MATPNVIVIAIDVGASATQATTGIAVVEVVNGTRQRVKKIGVECTPVGRMADFIKRILSEYNTPGATMAVVYENTHMRPFFGGRGRGRFFNNWQVVRNQRDLRRAVDAVKKNTDTVVSQVVCLQPGQRAVSLPKGLSRRDRKDRIVEEARKMLADLEEWVAMDALEKIPAGHRHDAADAYLMAVYAIREGKI